MRPTLFIWIPRTGGSSIWEAYSGMLSPEASQQWRLNVKYQEPIREDATLTTCSHAHIPSLIQYQIMSREWLERRFVFTFVRNPWDRLVSLYYYYRRLKRFFKGSFPEFIEAIRHGMPKPGTYNYYLLSMANPQAEWFDTKAIRHYIRPDFVGHFEHYERDWTELGRLIGEGHDAPPIIHTTKNKNESFRPQEPYQNSYTPATRDIVADLCREDIERFGYEFE